MYFHLYVEYNIQILFPPITTLYFENFISKYKATFIGIRKIFEVQRYKLGMFFKELFLNKKKNWECLTTLCILFFDVRLKN